MAVDCVRLLRDCSCRLSFGVKEKKETENAEEKNSKNELPESSFSDILDIGQGEKAGLGASATCLGYFAYRNRTQQKIPHWGRNFCANISRLMRFR